MSCRYGISSSVEHDGNTLRYLRYLLCHDINARLHALMGADLVLEGMAAASKNWSARD